MGISFLKKCRLLLFFPILMVLLLSLLNISACKFPPLFAPDGSVLVVTVNPDSIAIGESATVKVTGRRESGAPLPDKTVINFSTTMGRITPTSEIRNGYAIATLESSDGRSGEAVINVSSGNAEVSPENISVKIGNLRLEYIFLSASKLTLPPQGGETEIKATAYDKNMNVLQHVPIVFLVSAGSLLNGETHYTNAKGVVVDTLKTSSDTTVTAKSGSVTGILKIVLEKIPTANFSFSPSNPKIGNSVNFDASSSSDQDGIIIDYKWNFGDGKKGSGKNVSHVFGSPGIYNVKLTVNDNNGNSNICSKNINVSL